MTLRILVLIIGFIIPFISFSQNNKAENTSTSDKKGVVISTNQNDAPDQSAILHIKNQANEKAGFKFPEFKGSASLTDIDKDGDIDQVDFSNFINSAVKQPQNGLLFYNPDGNLQGFYHYDESSNIKWLKWATSNEKLIGVPDGTIIQYAGDLNLFTEDGIGKKGTSADGWYICNGKNFTPDLTASFVKGFNPVSDNIGTENDQSNDYFVITSDHLPQHTHDVINYSLNGGHSHKVFISPHKQDHYVYARSSQKVAARDHTDGNHTIAYRYAYEKNSDERDLNNAPLGVQNTEQSGQPKELDIKLVENEDIIAGRWLKEFGSETPHAIDNRPAFFVLVYIMKIEKPGQANNYTK